VPPGLAWAAGTGRIVSTSRGFTIHADARDSDLHTYYGHIHALKGISLHVEQGEVVTLIARTGRQEHHAENDLRFVAPREGRSSSTSPDRGNAGAPGGGLGVAQSPEGRRVFPRMTVRENLEMGAFIRGKADPADVSRVFDLFPRLKERVNQKAGTMSGGEQQMLAIGRALMARPTLLLLDEPSMGLRRSWSRRSSGSSRHQRQGTTVLLVEQNALMALAVANRGYVIQTGQIVLTDEAER
jgi:branched-chain amino acid transport system ATP-binding protein